ENQKLDIIEDTLRDAILTHGLPDAVYVDNGKQYRSNWLTKACAKLGIKLLHARPYHPEGKGKIERFNRRLDSFLAEASLQKPQSLEE
ncbi:DDE-type integrase/transposase/recombinase, partial [Klebsiella pneumoniae]|nr:DDE-type integrase/transposase/recombinase [Klebsiella pneumoniae]MCP6663620.1 DDE-type integrase/transposase/recombinase [Klebsiella pneumoniae]